MDIVIKEVEVRRKFNPGNYETMDIGVVATVGPGQIPDEVIAMVDKNIIRIGNERKKDRG